MTAHRRGYGVGHLLGLFERLRDHWLVVVALVTAVVWIRDMGLTYGTLPEEVARQTEAIAALETRVERLELRTADTLRLLTDCPDLSGGFRRLRDGVWVQPGPRPEGGPPDIPAGSPEGAGDHTVDPDCPLLP